MISRKGQKVGLGVQLPHHSVGLDGARFAVEMKYPKMSQHQDQLVPLIETARNEE